MVDRSRVRLGWDAWDLVSKERKDPRGSRLMEMVWCVFGSGRKKLVVARLTIYTGGLTSEGTNCGVLSSQTALIAPTHSLVKTE